MSSTPVECLILLGTLDLAYLQTRKFKELCRVYPSSSNALGLERALEIS